MFDFNGVLTTSPFTHMARSARTTASTAQVVLELMLGPYDEDTDHAWHRFERGEITVGGVRHRPVRTSGGGADRHRLHTAREPDVPARGARRRRRRVRDAARRAATAPVSSRTTSRRRPDSGGCSSPSTSCSTSSSTRPRSACASRTRPSTCTPSTCSAASRPARAVFLDDAPGNVAGARRAGLHAILVDAADPSGAPGRARRAARAVLDRGVKFAGTCTRRDNAGSGGSMADSKKARAPFAPWDRRELPGVVLRRGIGSSGRQLQVDRDAAVRGAGRLGRHRPRARREDAPRHALLPPRLARRAVAQAACPSCAR